MWQLSANYSSERGERKASFFSLYLTLSWLSQHTCSPVRVWRYIMALLLIRVVSSGMEAWHAEKIRLIWITCALFLFPLTVGDPRRRKMTGCLFSYTLDVILIPCAEFMFWSCLLCERSKMGLPCLLFYLANSCMLLPGWGSAVFQGWCIFKAYLISCWLYNSLSPALVLMKLSWETMHSFLPSSSVQTLTFEVIMRVVFSWLSLGFMAKQGVLLSSPNHWLDLGLILLKWLTQENWYRRSTSLWLDCWHFLCAEFRPRASLICWALFLLRPLAVLFYYSMRLTFIFLC